MLGKENPVNENSSQKHRQRDALSGGTPEKFWGVVRKKVKVRRAGALGNWWDAWKRHKRTRGSSDGKTQDRGRGVKNRVISGWCDGSFLIRKSSRPGWKKFQGPLT